MGADRHVEANSVFQILLKHVQNVVNNLDHVSPSTATSYEVHMLSDSHPVEGGPHDNKDCQTVLTSPFCNVSAVTSFSFRPAFGGHRCDGEDLQAEMCNKQVNNFLYPCVLLEKKIPAMFRI